MTGKAVLVIDDDPVLLKQIVSAFNRDRYTVDFAPDGVVGLKLFRADPPAIVITDLIMPEAEGIETIMAMRQARPDVKIVAMSGGGRGGAHCILNLAQHLGADRVITKPFRLSHLLALVDDLVTLPTAPA